MAEGARTGPRPTDGRRQARETAMVVLYEADLAGHPAGEVLQRRLEDEDAELPEAAGRRARQLVTGVLRHRDEIDAKIGAAAPSFPLSQMPPVEKSILRVALFEVLFDNGRVPLKAAISEAVELAKVFGSDSAPRFVNGVLSTIASEADAAGSRPADDQRSSQTEERER